MALLTCNFISDTLKRTVPMNVILPSDKILKRDGRDTELKPFKTLYLLHGLFGNYTDWVSNTRIQRWAEERDLAVVMPSGDNCFYVDQTYPNNAYGEFIGIELVDITRKMFRLSDRREDTFIGGLSMGGYGAMRNGLKYNDTFSHIVALSSAIHMFEEPFDTPGHTLIDEDCCFGDLEEAVVSDKNARVALYNLAERKKNDPSVNVPRIYMACGTEDRLTESNRAFRDHIMDCGFDLTYEEGEGVHDWYFWDTYIRRALDWLPLEVTGSGLNSGHTKLDD